ncbi:Calx-beta domain-containing protein [Flavobacterium sp. 3HN19-14]|uniref:Calx-beta domain-containing protein n=1 Tax=Flavobacterium sp. 3HN19-14 TaxID=3448133 RepID=UPI003EDF2BAF
MKKNYLKLLLLLLFALGSRNASAQIFYLSSASGSYSLIEGDSYVFSANLYSVSATPVVIDIVSVYNETNSADFAPFAATVTIPAGQLSTGLLTIVTGDDGDIEQNESFSLNATVTSGSTQNNEVSQYVTIIDNDAPPTLHQYLSANLIEGTGSSAYLNLSNPFHSDIAVTVNSADGTATLADYTPVNWNYIIPAGQTSLAVPYMTTIDNTPESDETFTITFTVTSGNTANNSAVYPVTIIDDDTVPSLSLASYQTTEGYDATVYANLSNPFNSPITITLTPSAGTAGTGDFTATPQTKVIPAGQTYTSFSIDTTDDGIDEPVEQFTATAVSAGISNSPVTTNCTIIDNDGLPDFVLDAYSGNKQEMIIEGGGIHIMAAMTAPIATPVVVNITTVPGTATAADYAPYTATLTIPPGQQSFSEDIYIPMFLDTLEEGLENFTVHAEITSGNVYNTSFDLPVTIIDDYNVNAHNDDVYSIANVGNTVSLLANDTLHGLPLNVADVTLTTSFDSSLGITVDANGFLTVPSTLAMGYYQLGSYTVCENANPANCSTTSVNVQVISPMGSTYTVTYSDYNGDGFTSVGDLISYAFTLTNNGNLPITNIDIQNSFQINIEGGPIASLAPGETDSTTFLCNTYPHAR